ncbi:hypothetical protein DVJ83_17180 (plasmid) [Deinococcus wulumuqiensis]|uniref:Uncharacterized protein n=1 Tax=Deinococcus wulumuqiensis TaxID=980427 RepID=A0A345IMD0_9DEIO|nr:hypothetical protein [Deinococcus wulumuqiensis]AXH00853.1 hypothetical protein DVJ83_17180 [Deinococcus wulumuqiensis]
MEVYFDYSGVSERAGKEVAAWGAALFLDAVALPQMLFGGELVAPGSEAEALNETVRALQERGLNQVCQLYTDDIALVRASTSLPEGFQLRYTARETPRHLYAHDTARLYRRRLELVQSDVPPSPSQRPEVRGGVGVVLTCRVRRRRKGGYIGMLKLGNTVVNINVNGKAAHFQKRLHAALELVLRGVAQPTGRLHAQVLSFFRTHRRAVNVSRTGVHREFEVIPPAALSTRSVAPVVRCTLRGERQVQIRFGRGKTLRVIRPEARWSEILQQLLAQEGLTPTEVAAQLPAALEHLQCVLSQRAPRTGCGTGISAP